MRAKRLAAIVAATVITAWAGTAIAQETEEDIPFDQLPPSVRKVAEEHVGKGEIRRVVKEVERGAISYEIEIVENGKEKDVVIDSNGELVEIGREMDVESLPKRVFDGLIELAGGGRILEVESTSRADTVTYEAVVVTPAGGLRKVKVGADGRRLAPPSP